MKNLLKIFFTLIIITLYSITLGATTVKKFDIQATPNKVKVGESIDITIRALDKDGNIVKDYVGEVLIFSESDTNAEFSGVLKEYIYNFKISDAGIAKLENAVKFTKEGVHDINVYDTINDDIFGFSEVEVTSGKTIPIVLNDKQKYLEQKMRSINNLKKAKKEKYITKIDKIVYGTNKEKLKKIFNKIQKLKKKNDVINYLESVIYLSINNEDTIQEEKNTKIYLVKEAQDFDKINNINRIYGDEKDNNLKGIDTKRNIIWGKEGQDILYGGKLDDIIIVVGDMSKYGKNDTKQTLEFLGFKIEEINGKNFNIFGSPKIIDGGDGEDILFVTGDIDFSNTEILGIEHVIIH